MEIELKDIGIVIPVKAQMLEEVLYFGKTMDEQISMLEKFCAQNNGLQFSSSDLTVFKHIYNFLHIPKEKENLTPEKIRKVSVNSDKKIFKIVTTDNIIIEMKADEIISNIMTVDRMILLYFKSSKQVTKKELSKFRHKNIPCWSCIHIIIRHIFDIDKEVVLVDKSILDLFNEWSEKNKDTIKYKFNEDNNRFELDQEFLENWAKYFSENAKMKLKWKRFNPILLSGTNYDYETKY